MKTHFFHFIISELFHFFPKRHLLNFDFYIFYFLTELHFSFLQFQSRWTFSQTNISWKLKFTKIFFWHNFKNPFYNSRAVGLFPKPTSLENQKTHFQNFLFQLHSCILLLHSLLLFSNRTSFIGVRGNYFLLEGARSALKKFLGGPFFFFVLMNFFILQNIFCWTFCFSSIFYFLILQF